MQTSDLFRTYLLKKYVLPQWLRLASLTLLTLAAFGLSLAAPLLSRQFIDQIAAGDASSTIARSTLAFVCVALLAQVIAVIDAYVAEGLVWSSTNSLRIDLIEHCINLDARFFQEISPGALVERVDGDVQQLSAFLSRFLVNIVTNTLQMFGILTVLSFIEPRIGMAYTLFAFVMIAALALTQRLAMPHWASLRTIATATAAFLDEKITGLDDLAANGAIPYVLRGSYVLIRRQLVVSWKAGVASCVTDTVYNTCTAVGQGMAAGLGAYFYLHGVISVGTVVLLFSYVAMLLGPLSDFSGQITDWGKTVASLSRIELLLKTKSQLHSGEGIHLSNTPCEIEFDSVNFGYHPEQAVVDGVSFRINPGEVCGIVGRSGSGKTTLARLLYRQYDPDQGSIRWNGVDIRQGDISLLRSKIGFATQEVQLFKGSVRDNLTLFNDEIPCARIVEILNEIGLSTWLNELPDGLDTKIQRNATLSAGQAQLLSLARIFLKDPQLVVLDEITSYLDDQVEHDVHQAVDRLLVGRTVLIIAHHPSALRRADRILMMENGRLRDVNPSSLLMSEIQQPTVS